ncbi:guanine nucleotide exchange protein smcr8a isoform X2 [Strongylocentrotus purpuratus]|uniref:UDENN FLCN/SMCR8-type domain-containing protein n=1 Tax=Strongylocentrotus purpuratus TaxID=7668 RepID=A0A7M7PFL2_STRPU|nr:guanine nucleotide exchange protein smcr8a isoform X2 [Strongylocentrotus purpuratus]
MLGGIPQVAQLYSQSPEMNYFDSGKDEAAFVRSRPPLPSELAQSYRPPTPWPVSPTCQKDFVLVCEFSELEGPKPLITIPKDGGSSFDKNMYAVKIMAVDYNATNYARSTNTFKLSEDTSVVLEDKKDGSYSYIHHFTLYDIHARGFVRPFCMAYITPDKNKLRSNLQHIMASFHQVSQYYRYGNYVIFREEMIRRLADLIFTKESIKTQLEEMEVKQEARVERARRHIHKNNHILHPNSNSTTNNTTTTTTTTTTSNTTTTTSNTTATNGKSSSEGEDDGGKERRKEGTEESAGDAEEQEQEIVAELKEYARKREELEAVEKAIREIEVILEAVTPALKKNKKMEMRYRRLKERYSDPQTNKPKPAPAQNIHQEGYCSDEDKCRQPHKSRLRKRSSSHSEMVEETNSNNDPNAPYQPQIVQAINPRRFDRSLRTLHELCSYGAKEGLNRLRKLLKFYCRDANILFLEKQESPLVEPSVSLLTIGRTVTLNFLNAINLQCIASCQWELHGLGRRSQGMSASVSMESFSSCQEDQSVFDSLPPSYEARFVMGSTYASLESLYYEVDESMEDLFLCADPTTPLLDKEGLFIEESFGSWVDISHSSLTDQQASSSASSDPRTHPFPAHNHQHQHHCQPRPSGEEEDEGAENGDVFSSQVLADIRVQPSSPSSSSIDTGPSNALSPTEERDAVAMEKSSDAEPRPHLSHQPHRNKLSSGEEEDGISMETMSSKEEGNTKLSHKGASSIESLEKYASVPSGQEPVLRRNTKIPVGCYASRLASTNSDLPGSGIKEFISRYVFAIHLIYALLSGRTVVIAASPTKEREVNSLVRTLWLFVPGHSSRYHLVVPWHTKPLCMTDLARMKLVGLSKPKSLGRVVPSSVRRYVTLFDYDHQTLWTPAYKGNILDSIVNRNKHFQIDQCYLAHIQSVLLQLASKAFLYYHSYCLNSPNSRLINSTSSADSTSRLMNSSPARVNSASFLSKLGLVDGDCKIVEYWVELIKRQQLDEIMRQQGYADIPSPSIRLDHRVCNRYQM